MTVPVQPIVLAAGRASRMGNNKLLADLAGKPVIAHVVAAIDKAGLPPPIIVTGHDPLSLQGVLCSRPAQFVQAREWKSGLSRSLAAGVAAVPEACIGALICLGDMPFVSHALLGRVACAMREDRIVAPVRHGLRGHPVGWGRAWFGRLQALEGDAGGRALLAADPDLLHLIDTDEEGIHIDIDTPEALAAARVRAERS